MVKTGYVRDVRDLSEGWHLLMSGWKKLNKEILIDTLEDYEILHVKKIELQS